MTPREPKLAPVNGEYIIIRKKYSILRRQDMARVKTWEISDAFWELVKPLIPTSPRVDEKGYKRKSGGGRKRKYSDRLYFAAIVFENDPTFKARRWVVELAHSWFNRFRKLLPRYEKTDLSYNALNAFAAAMIVLNKIMVIYR